MKSRSISPVHVHIEDITPVHVHVQRSQSLPASTQKSHVVRFPSADMESGRRKKKGKMVYRPHSPEKYKPKTDITAKQAERICRVIQSSDLDFERDTDVPAKWDDGRFDRSNGSRDEFAGGRKDILFEERSEEMLHGSRRSAGGLSPELVDRTEELDETGTSAGQTSSYLRTTDLEMGRLSNDAAPDKKLFLKTLIEAESAANSAAIQLVSFKDTLSDLPSGSCFAAPDKLTMSRQKNLLLEKLENFKGVNKALRQQLKELQKQEESRHQADRHIDILLKKLTETETENLHLRRNLNEKERRVEELLDLCRKETENSDTVVQLSKSVEATRAHLQGRLRSKEAENNRLAVQLRSLERTITEQKLEMENLKQQITSIVDKAGQEKEALKKATRAQKQRAERFEAAIEKCYSQMQEKDAKLTESLSAANTWRRHYEELTKEKAQLEIQIGTLQMQITDLGEQLQKGRDHARISNEELLHKVEKLHSENADVNLENAKLKATISDLEEKVAHSLAELQEQTAVSQQQKDLVEQYKTQVKELQKEADDLKTSFEAFLKENQVTQDGKEAEIKKVDEQTQQLKSSLDVKDSLQEANLQLQLRMDALQRKTEEIESENRELVSKLSSQEEALHYSGKQLEKRSAECLSLTRQLEAALADVRQQVSEVKEKAFDRERALQSKILELETEKSRRDKELKQLRQSKQSTEKQYEVRLKDLQLSLEQSESHKQSIQNYVDFLKNSYATMFGEGLSPSFGTSSF
ncbi:protein BCAP isoform X2 [Amia ocellicauda]|uniref:protein BCAP isoform X2 n=1 Tax=Amia ocellicauda TaxID=2972642 RepID=UPI0034638E8F